MCVPTYTHKSIGPPLMHGSARKWGDLGQVKYDHFTLQIFVVVCDQNTLSNNTFIFETVFASGIVFQNVMKL